MAIGKLFLFPPKPATGFLVRFVLLLFIVSLAVSLAVSDATSSIHDLLRRHGLPGGLIPKGVKSFYLHEETGFLEVNLNQPCFAKYDNMAYFDQVVRGNLSYGELKGLVGLSQEELFLWLPVKGIMVSDTSSGVIMFDIGVAHKQLSVSLFEDPPDCRPVRGRAPTYATGVEPRIHGIPERKETGGSSKPKK